MYRQKARSAERETEMERNYGNDTQCFTTNQKKGDVRVYKDYLIKRERERKRERGRERGREV